MTGDLAAYRPRRSVLYLPSSNERALEKAKALPVDALILDLEDAVAPEAKDAARENACAAVRSGAYGRRELTIRVNGTGSAWHDADLAAACAAGPDGDRRAQGRLGRRGALARRGDGAAGAPEHTRLWAMVETPVAVLHVERDRPGVRPSRRASSSAPTTSTRSSAPGTFAPGRAAIQVSLRSALLAARAAGVAVLDGVFNDVRDLEGFAAEAGRAASWASTARP